MPGLLNDLGQGLISAGAALNPQVMQGVLQRQRDDRSATQQTKELQIRQIVSGIENGSIPADQGAAALQQLGVNVPAGPSIQTQQAQQQMDLNRQALDWLRQRQSQANAPQGQSAPPASGLGLGGGLTDMPPAVMASPIGKGVLDRQIELRKLNRPQLPEGMRADLAKFTPESIQNFMQTGNSAVLEMRAPEVKDAPLSGVGKLKADLTAGRINQVEYDAELKKMTHVPAVKVSVSGGNEADVSQGVSDDIALARTGMPKSQIISGWGKNAFKRWNEIKSGAIEGIMKENPGISRQDAATMFAAEQQEYRGNSLAVGNVLKDLASIRPYKEMLDKNVDIAANLADKAIATDSKWANKKINWLKQNATDNPDVAEYLAQMTIVQTEAARVLNNPRLVGQLTDAARHEMQEVISGDMPLNATKRVLKRIQNDGANRVNAMVKERDTLLKKGATGEATASPAAPPAAGPKPGDVQQGYRFKGGNPADQKNWDKVQ